MSTYIVYPVSKEQLLMWIAKLPDSHVKRLLFSQDILIQSLDSGTGLYLDNVLIGVCLLGKVEQTLVSELPLTSISAIYIKPEFRGKGYGTYLFTQTVNLLWMTNNIPVFVEIMSTRLRAIVAKFRPKELLDIKHSVPIFDTFQG